VIDDKPKLHSETRKSDWRATSDAFEFAGYVLIRAAIIYVALHFIFKYW
jgi:hypothetical protein